MDIEANDLIQVLTEQRNSANHQAAMLGAANLGLQRKVAELEKQLKEKTNEQG